MVSAPTQQGFTLVEMIVSLTLFSVVITITVGALLSLIGSNDQLRNQQSVMTNLAFALDSMTREIRTGSYYYCGNNLSDFTAQESLATSTRDCLNASGNPVGSIGLSFIEGGNSVTGSGIARIAYFFENNQIWRQVGNRSAQSMTADGIYIADMQVWVTGSRTLSAGGLGSVRQPTVTIFIDARDSATGQPNYVQTTITQRALDL